MVVEITQHLLFGQKLVSGKGTFDQTQWPKLARMIGILKIEADLGVGDTIERHVPGGDWVKLCFKKLLGRDCGCTQRQHLLNVLFPYK